MFKLYSLSGLLALSLLTSGCFSKSSPAQVPLKSSTQHISNSNSNMPSWYNNPQQTDYQNYYGVGVGDSEKEAVAMALSKIASEISTTIASVFESKSTVKNGESSKEMLHQVKAIVKGVTFNGAVVEESDITSDGEYVVMMRVDRKSFANDEKRKFQQEQKKVETLYNHTMSNDSFVVLANYQTLEQELNRLVARASFLKGLDSSFDYSTVSQKSNSMLSKLLAKSGEIYLYVPEKSSLGYETLVRKYLTKSGYKIANSSKGQGDILTVHVTIHHQPKEIRTTNERLKSLKFATVEVILSTVNSRGDEVAKNRFEFTNNGVSYEDAISDLKKFTKRLDKDGVVKVLRGE